MKSRRYSFAYFWRKLTHPQKRRRSSSPSPFMPVQSISRQELQEINDYMALFCIMRIGQ